MHGMLLLQGLAEGTWRLFQTPLCQYSGVRLLPQAQGKRTANVSAGLGGSFELTSMLQRLIHGMPQPASIVGRPRLCSISVASSQCRRCRPVALGFSGCSYRTVFDV